MTENLDGFVEEFPLAEPGEIDPTTIQGNLDEYLRRLLRILGYDDTVIHAGVEIEISEDAYEPTDLDFRSSLDYPAYVGLDPNSSPYLVGKGSRTMVSSPLSRDGDYQMYEEMRVYHEAADSELTVFLTPFDIFVCDGEIPMDYYTLQEFDSQAEEELRDELQPPEYLSQ